MIEIPFQDQFKPLMSSGRKTATTRTKRYGLPGEKFKAFGLTFVLMDVRRIELDRVASYYFNPEGFESREEFISCWESLHPRRGWVPDQQVWLHQFVHTCESNPCPCGFVWNLSL